jgi:hypothetical protein
MNELKMNQTLEARAIHIAKKSKKGRSIPSDEQVILEPAWVRAGQGSKESGQTDTMGDGAKGDVRQEEASDRRRCRC